MVKKTKLGFPYTYGDELSSQQAVENFADLSSIIAVIVTLCYIIDKLASMGQGQGIREWLDIHLTKALLPNNDPTKKKYELTYFEIVKIFLLMLYSSLTSSKIFL